MINHRFRLQGPQLDEDLPSGRMRQMVVPNDVATAAEFCRATFKPHTDKDWTTDAAGLEWDCRETTEHVIDALEVYTVQLARRSRDYFPAFRRARDPATPVKNILRIMVSRAAILGEVASAAGTDARAFHPMGVSDASGFVAMGCTEILVHGADVARALGVPFDPGADLVGRVLDRLFPWAPDVADPWPTLLWATGRHTFTGYPDLREHWVWWCRPLKEWDGEFKTDANLRRLDTAP